MRAFEKLSFELFFYHSRSGSCRLLLYFKESTPPTNAFTAKLTPDHLYIRI